MIKSILFAFLLMTSALSYSQEAEPLNSIDLIDGLILDANNPLTFYAQKKNGEFKNSFRVPFRALVDYYNFAGQGFIVENKELGPIRNLDSDVITSRTLGDIPFHVNLSKRKAFPTMVLSPDTVSNLFILDPQVYTTLAHAPDFLTAKELVYKTKGFNSKKFKYDNNLVHLEDWRSLNHPPVQKLGDDLTIWDQNLTEIDYSQTESVYYNEDFQKKIDEISSTELTFGNKLELLENGNSYQRKLVEVGNAKSSILMAVMSFFCDDSSRLLEDQLIKKAKEGVDVRLMVEKVWTKLIMKKCLNRMIDGGVDVVLANDLLKRKEEKALFHDKFMIIDSKIVIMGGSNIMSSDNISTGTNHMNRDNDVYIEGPIATDATLSFASLWKKYTKKKNQSIDGIITAATIQKDLETQNGLRGQTHYAEKLNNPSLRSQGVCRFMNQSPSGDKNKLSKVFIAHIENASKRMAMTNGNAFYFDLPEHKDKERARDTWNKKLYRSLFASVERGVKLDIIGNGIDGGYGEASNTFKRMYLKNRFRVNPLPRLISSFLADMMDKAAAKNNQPYLEELAKKDNLRAWTHFQYMHSKKMQFDRLVTVVSSYNLDEWSADKSHESAVICMDDGLNKQMERSLLQDIVNSQPAAISK